MKTITYNNGTEDITLTVLAVSSGVYNGVKNTLKFIVDGSDHSFDDIHGILENTGEIIEKEDGVVTFTHAGFELLPESSLLGIQRDSTQSAVVDIQDALVELSLAVVDLQGRIAALEGGEVNG